MNRLKSNKIFRFFASIRFAIPVMVAWAIGMCWGTIAESRFGTDYAKIAVYHSWWFYAIQGAIALSLLLAMVARIPLRQRLTGFYIVHIALLVVIGGAVVTRYYGIDGLIELNPGREASEVRLEEDRLYLSQGDTERAVTIPSAYKALEIGETVSLDDGAKVTLVRYLPYAQATRSWVQAPGAWLTEWTLKNERMEQKFELSNRPSEEVADRIETGALQVELVDLDYATSLARAISSAAGEFALLHRTTGQIVTVPSLEAKPHALVLNNESMRLVMTENKKIGLKIYRLERKGETLSFFPRFSAAPVTSHMNADLASEFRLLSLGAYREKATVLISRAGSGEVFITFGKGKEWKSKVYREPIELPWMGLKLELASEKIDVAAISTFEAAVPSKDAARNMKAMLVRLEQDGQSEETWFTDRGDGGFQNAAITGRIGKEIVQLPFTMTLDRFEMDRVPRTNEPASYESFVRVSGEAEPLHIFMNHPYKAAGYTFYQSSYYQDETTGEYHSVLSVNKDPGRGIKYLGSLLLVIGLVIHFMILYGYFPEKKKAQSHVAESRARLNLTEAQA